MIGETTQLIGEAPAWLSAQEHVSRVAPLERPILVIGERGTGKELIGERLHFLSKRWEGPFVKVNCAALSEQLLDSELFGHERGAFTGATEQRKGRFELADGGTIFLDEIATASRAVQEKLLRIVEYGEFQRLGGSRVLTTNVRIVAATNMHLPGMVERGEFRADLLDRLAFDVITLPPLRARPLRRSKAMTGRETCANCVILPSGSRIARCWRRRTSPSDSTRPCWIRLPRPGARALPSPLKLKPAHP